MDLSTARKMAALTVAASTLLAVLPIAPADAQWVMIGRRAIGRVHQIVQGATDGKPGLDVASVVLDAPAAKVYATMASLVHKNTAVRIVKEEPAKREIVVAEGDRSAHLSVIKLSDDLSQLMVVGKAGPSEDSTSSRVVSRVLQVCQEMQKQCSVKPKS
jgi:hypothetical protein